MADEEKVKLDSKSAKANLEQKKQQGEDLSEEDVIVIQELERIVSSIQQEVGKSNELPATKELRDLLMISKSSMASVTKHLKFLKPHYGPLVQLLKTSTRPTDKYLLADVLSFVGMIYGRDSKDALNFRLMANEYRKNPSADQSDLIEAISAYGHEYARYLALEIKQSYAENQDSEGEEDLMKVDDTSEKLIDLARVIAQFFILKGPDLDAIDLLSEVNCVREIPNIISADIYDRVCKYLVSCSQTLPHEDAVVFLEAAHNIYTRYGTPLDRLPLSLKLGDNERVLKDFGDCQTSAERKQAAFLLSRQRFDITQLGKHDDEFLSMCLQGTYLSDYYLRVAKSLQIMEPKKPADIYKSQFETVISSSSSSKDYISSTYVNAFVNAGFKEDSMVLTKDKNSNQSVISSKGKSSVSITAALGMVLMWSDSETSAEIILEYLSSENNTIKAGALLALGLNSVGLRQESDLTKALAGDYLEETSVSDSSENQVKRAGLLSLGIAYAKTGDREVTEILTKFLHPEKRSIRTISFAALSLGLVHLGSGNAEVISILLDVLREMRPQDLTHTYTRFIILGLALTAMCRRDVVIFDSKSPNEEDAPTDITSTYINVTDLGDPVKMQAKVLVGACSMAGSGEVLEVQKLLRILTNPPPAEKDDEKSGESKDEGDGEKKGEATGGEAEEAAKEPGKKSAGGASLGASKASSDSADLHQAFAVLGVAMIAMSEQIGSQMVLRMFDHIMQYGCMAVRRMVPLAIGLVCTSNPEPSVIDTLSKYSHDNDSNVAMSATFAMGLIGAGTNHARLAQLLRQLASYYARNNSALFVVRLALGMLHMGKGTITLNPFHHERFLLSQSALAGLLVSIMVFTSPQEFIFSDTDYLLYFLALAMWPRFLLTLTEDEHTGELIFQPVDVQVGEAVDVVGKAGKHKTIKGFQSHQTPVILAHSERAEIATEEYVVYTSVLEGPVIVRKNPNYEEQKA